jgi:hypothetical protein
VVVDSGDVAVDVAEVSSLTVLPAQDASTIADDNAAAVSSLDLAIFLSLL